MMEIKKAQEIVILVEALVDAENDFEDIKRASNFVRSLDKTRKVNVHLNGGFTMDLPPKTLIEVLRNAEISLKNEIDSIKNKLDKM